MHKKVSAAEFAKMVPPSKGGSQPGSRATSPALSGGSGKGKGKKKRPKKATPGTDGPPHCFKFLETGSCAKGDQCKFPHMNAEQYKKACAAANKGGAS